MKNNYYILHHYSITKLDKITVSNFGLNSYSRNEAKIKVNRSFFYLDSNYIEFTVKSNAKFKHISEIKKSEIYDLTEDSLNLTKKIRNIESLLNKIKKLGFKGIKYFVGFDIVSLFYDIKVKKVESLTK